MATTVIDSIEHPIDGWRDMASRWGVLTTLLGGTLDMRSAGKSYLKQWPQEDDADYIIRLEASVLYNAYRKAVNGLTGRVFAKPIQLGEDVPADIVAFMENIDLAGRGLQPFARDVFKDGFYGLSHILIDAPSTAPETLEDERSSGFRPYWIHVKAHDLIGWRAKIVNGVYKLTQVRIRESYLKEAGIYAEVPIDRIRLLEPGRFEIWDAVGKDNAYMKVDEGETGIGYIPLVTYYANRTGHMIAEPPLEDMAHLNVKHWQISSDSDNTLHVASVPLLHFAGFPPDFADTDGEASVSNAFVGPEASKVAYIEHSGKAIGASKTRLDELKEEMDILSMQMLIQKSGSQTATAKAIDTAEANSELESMALNLQDALEQALMITADRMGKGEDAGGSLAVSTDFGINMHDSADLEALLKARGLKDISRETLWKEFKRRGLLMDDFDSEVEEARLLGDPDAIGVMSLAPSEAEKAIMKALAESEE
jgi:hypothetical protein